MSQPLTALQWVGVASLCVIVLAGVVPLIGRPFDPSSSVSQSWGERQRFSVLMGMVLTVFGAGFCLFIVGWLTPAYGLPHWMYYVAAVAYLGILGVAWVRIVDKPAEHPVHHPHFLGGIAGASAITASYATLLFWASSVPRLSYYLTLIAFAYSLCWPLFFLPRVREYFLVLECMFVFLFVLVILSLTAGW